MTLISTTSTSYSFPSAAYLPILEEAKLRSLWTFHPSCVHPKVFPLPEGPKWAFRSTQLYGENDSRSKLLELYRGECAASPERAFDLFSVPRSVLVWGRPMNLMKQKLCESRISLLACDGVAAPPALVATREEALADSWQQERSTERLCQTDYLQKLRTCRFVVCPRGNGLDTHATWEALMCGCVPIRATIPPG